MNKRIRQYVGILSTVITYYVIHEGAHLLYALYLNVFKQIRFMGLGIQIDIYADKLTSLQMTVFCALGSIATLIACWILVFNIDKMKNISFQLVKACLYYITIGLLFIDPLYLSVLCGFVGGGDMNGISLIIPSGVARLIYACVFVMNIIVFRNIVLPKYKEMFKSE